MRVRSHTSLALRSGRAALVAGLALACGETPVEAPAPIRPIKILRIDAGSAAGVLEYLGQVSAVQSSEMAFEVAGKIMEFLFTEGARVTEGALLAKLDPRDYQAKLDAETAKLEQARSEYQRSQALFAADVIAKQELERKKRAFEVTKAGVQKAAKGLEDTELRAPFDGVLARKLVQDYQNVQAKQAVLVLQDDSSLELKVDVPEQDLSRAQPGLTVQQALDRVRVQVIVTTFPDRIFPARLKELAMTADPVTRTFEATLGFATPTDIRVLPGMTAKALLQPPQQEGKPHFAVPSHAVLADEAGAAYVWLVEPDSMQVERRAVQTGELTGSRIEVRAGLSAGDQIAVSGVQKLREGMQVRRLEN